MFMNKSPFLTGYNRYNVNHCKYYLGLPQPLYKKEEEKNMLAITSTEKTKDKGSHSTAN